MLTRFATTLVLLAPLACSVGLDKHPLKPEQSAALRSRPAPAAEEEVKGLTTIMVSVPVEAPAEKVWDQLAVNFGDVHRWSGAIAESGLVNAPKGGKDCTRSCKLGPSSPIGKNESFQETILEWDPDGHYFVAGVDDGFYPMRQVVQEFWVEATPSGSNVVTQFHYDMSFPMGRGRPLKKKLKPQIVRSLLGLKHLVETGRAAESQDTDFLAQRYPNLLAANGVT